MFFDQNEITVRILDVLTVDQGQSDTLNQRGYHAISFRLEADTRLSFRDRTIHAGSGSISYFPANLSYRRQSVRDRMIVIHFDTDDYFSGSIELINIIDPGPVQEQFEKALQCWNQKNSGYYFETAACFYNILALTRKEITKTEVAEIPKLLTTAFSLLNERFTDPDLTVSTLAKEANISEVYFRKLFRETTGLSPRQYLVGKRIAYATALLESRCFSIQQVAEQVGFPDSKYFSVVFKKTVGCSPSEYLYHWEENDCKKIDET